MPKIILIASNRFSKEQTRFDYFDVNFNWLDLEWGNPRSSEKPTKPKAFDEIIKLASILSEGIPHVRVDFYIVGNQIYFGELTFFDGGGFEEIQQEKWNLEMGAMLKLPEKYNK